MIGSVSITGMIVAGAVATLIMWENLKSCPDSTDKVKAEDTKVKVPKNERVKAETAKTDHDADGDTDLLSDDHVRWKAA